MKTIELPEIMLRVKRPVYPPGYEKGNVNRMFDKVWEHEKNYFK